MAVNSRAGLLYNVLHIAAARLRRFRCVLHHPVVTYIEVPDRKMRLLLRIAPRDTMHVMACQQMIDDFNQAYDTKVNALIVPRLVVDCVAVNDVSGITPLMLIPRHHFEAGWPRSHERYVANGNMEDYWNKKIDSVVG